MKALLLYLILLLLCTPLFARHGKGGSITYEYLGNGSTVGTSKYRITVKHYIDCGGTQFIEPNVYVGIMDVNSKRLIKTLTFGQKEQRTIDKKYYDACINKKPVICYVIVTYVTETDLMDNASGYMLVEQECCRIGGIINVQNSSNYGITNTNQIPGVINGIVYRKNSSPVYAQKDTAVICHNAYFEIDFSATDDDGDVLTYEFCAGKTGGTAQARQPNPPDLPPYTDIPYTTGYSASAPLGDKVKIDSKTGIISGIAPAQLGSYVVSVCVSEFRNGKLIGLTKKEVQVNIADCNLSVATLEPSYINCEDFDFGFRNKSASPLIEKYYWDFGVPNSSTDTSTRPLPFFTYPDTGTYVLKLRVSSGAGCQDSTEAKVIVYPGFKPGFAVAGNCYQAPFLFTDTSYAKYGVIDSWLWDLGDNNSIIDSSTARNFFYQFPGPAQYPVTLSVTSSKGCYASITRTVEAPSTPPLGLSVKDTLICNLDSLQLNASGNGIFSWAASSTLMNGNTSSPIVFPKAATTYVVTLNAHGCINKDSVRVRVTDHITVSLNPDTTICSGDRFTLHPVSEGVKYQWLPQTGLDDPFAKTATGRTSVNTRYLVQANLGRCMATSAVNVRVVKYPEVHLPADTTICYGSSVMLNAIMRGASFQWKPSASLTNTNTLSPVASPLTSAMYILTVTDNLGCPKPVSDTMNLNVLPRVIAFAGNDTSITADEPLQLRASGGRRYEWTPSGGLNNSHIADPVARLNNSYNTVSYMVRVSTPEGCYADDAIEIKIYKTKPEIFVPTAFTPNQDGMNDILRPILVGIKKLEFFNVYNRWGKLVYSTSDPGKGWDGRTGGILQENGNYVFIAQAVDYLGNSLKKKGYFVLLK